MAIFKSILAPTDFSDVSAAGVRYACQLAKAIGAEIIIFNVDVLDESTASISARSNKQKKAREVCR
jgi:nucleotide-binding universal stress UspA family protein